MSGMNSALEFGGGEPLPEGFRSKRTVLLKPVFTDYLTRQNADRALRDNHPPVDAVGDDQFNSLLALIFASLCASELFTDRIWLMTKAIGAAEACPSSPDLIYDPHVHYLAVLNSWLDQLHDTACRGTRSEDTA